MASPSFVVSLDSLNNSLELDLDETQGRRSTREREMSSRLRRFLKLDSSVTSFIFEESKPSTIGLTPRRSLFSSKPSAIGR